MVNLFKRMRKLKSIVNIRIGTGAAILPTPTSATPDYPAITRLHLTYARKIYNGHQGARHFWRNCLPRLKYHNPGVPMSVKQTDDQEGPAALTIYFAERASKPASITAAVAELTDKHAPAPGDAEKTAIVDLRNLDYREIWNKVMNVTGAKEVPASAEEEAEVKRFEQMREQSGRDRVRIAAIRQAKKDQERMLQIARGEVEKLREL
ncbi:50S ribosomal protein Mrp49 [Aspergillus campestris IBT 28561]|uniref:50S ribosomal protein Mrp49 n=1 Tax=Aspergillus campestris (strain IBT 28561) TaxID=1392248 RepID=A0A2I1DBV3_ASPC2|nr:50S ribosomal protein Mrp49 [Aspergillus campestris IBT 28561]PKY07343.1 50S ribosomal protein Mrp49 [Aspergillus campestris IBT 28561]